MIDFVGSEPDGINEYMCSECKAEFLLRRGIEEWADGAEPKYCPYCGKRE